MQYFARAIVSLFLSRFARRSCNILHGRLFRSFSPALLTGRAIFCTAICFAVPHLLLSQVVQYFARQFVSPSLSRFACRSCNILHGSCLAVSLLLCSQVVQYFARQFVSLFLSCSFHRSCIILHGNLFRCLSPTPLASRAIFCKVVVSLFLSRSIRRSCNILHGFYGYQTVKSLHDCVKNALHG